MSNECGCISYQIVGHEASSIDISKSRPSRKTQQKKVSTLAIGIKCNQENNIPKNDWEF
jgi:hypothetical protein